MVFFYDIFQFFDYRLNKGTNDLLYYFIFIILLGRNCFNTSDDWNVRAGLHQHLVRDEHLHPEFKLAQGLRSVDDQDLLLDASLSNDFGRVG